MMVSVFTVGHSTRPIDEFIELLKGYDVKQLIDIRTVPGSRHNPQYGQAALQDSLQTAGIRYRYLKQLGGLRHGSKESVNTGWRNASFRARDIISPTSDPPHTMTSFARVDGTDISYPPTE